MYTNVKVNISNSQKEKLNKSLETGQQLSLSYNDLIGCNYVIALTQPQLNRLQIAYENEKGLTIKMSKTQIAQNMKVKGGFLPLLVGLASQALQFFTVTVLPALGVGALSGLASTGVQKLMGNGLYIKKGGYVCEIEADGNQLLLEPVSGRMFTKLWAITNATALADIGGHLI